MIVLELFKGTGSVGKIAERLGYEVISVDIDPKSKATYTTDILKLDYRKLPIPDYIHASPPCDTFSCLVWSKPVEQRCRDIKTAQPLNEKGELGTKILYRTLKIIDYFKRKNPNLAYVIENPRGMMRNDPKMKELPRFTTSYNLWGDDRYKPTDFWSNLPLKLPKPRLPKGDYKRIGQLSLKNRYKIPSKLIEYFFDAFEKFNSPK